MDDGDQSVASSNPAVAEEYDYEDDDNEEYAVPVASVVASGHSNDDNDDSDVDAEKDFGDDDREDLDAGVDDDDNSIGTGDNSSLTPLQNRKRSLSEASPTPPGMIFSSKKGRMVNNDGQPRQPAVRELTLPYRSIKRTMKLDRSVGIVQNDAAILVTYATELFIKKLAKDSQEISMKKGRGTIKYDDLAEARAKTKAFSFLGMLIP
ncbi:hypothetical protein HJC23_001639 [Cyclotella cryptica]|uniref:Transcription factor CBF/NF-Y/archaeal histone domain-containing protein n=1 Tax=Cyclotella cryptica TaxID=29204 RepID=A0ABD3QK55_9STRA|eukprot:CCRYP_004670-RA/>CCRYP_004670-RA protein AED:0.07 eAED:0.07 QI:397/-1/1/1/-1/1/1/148/206